MRTRLTKRYLPKSITKWDGKNESLLELAQENLKRAKLFNKDIKNLFRDLTSQEIPF